jgi:hypothetical protein
MDVMLTVEAWLPFGTCLPPVVIAEPTVHPYHELSRLDARAAAYTRVPVRRVERGLVIERTT